MDCLPEALVQHILSYLTNARDVVSSSCVSKRWKDSLPYIRSLYFPRNIFECIDPLVTSDHIIWKIISSVVRLEELVVYCPFTTSGLASWLTSAGNSLRQLELRMDNLNERLEYTEGAPRKLDCIQFASKLESLKLWGVLMDISPKWDVFHNLKTLEIVGAKISETALSDALQACPNLTHFMLIGCDGEGVMYLSFEFKHLVQCKLDFYGSGNNSLSLSCPKLTTLEVQGCSWIRVPETRCLQHLSIANNAGRVQVVDFGKLEALDSLSVRGIQWHWDAISRLLHLASEVKHLFMKVEFTGDLDNLLPFPEIDLVEFFNAHPKLQTFDIHGAMFAALCQKNSLKNADSTFSIPHLEEVTLTVRSPLNAEQKMSTLESLLRYSCNLKKMVIKILQMKSSHSSADDFFEEVCKFTYMNRHLKGDLSRVYYGRIFNAFIKVRQLKNNYMCFNVPFSSSFDLVIFEC
ncbi:hypothetical protein V2J09_014668 [Rumex salicifolius]